MTWTVTSLAGGIILALTGTGSAIFAGTAAGVLKSTNKGMTWEAVNNGLTSTQVQALAWDGTNLFAGTWGGGVFRSSDNGGTWTAASSGILNTIVLSLANSGTSLFAGTYGGGVFASPNDGTLWRTASTGITDISTHALLVSDGTMYAGTTGGLFVSNTSGRTWAMVGGIDNAAGSDFAVIGTNVFAATSEGVFVSSDDGSSWTGVNSGLPPLAVYALTVNGSNLFASIPGEGVFLSTNNGASWTEVNNGLTIPHVWALASLGGNVFAGTGGGGVFRSTDNGSNWVPVNNGMASLSLYALGVNGTTIFAGTAGVVYRSTNNGDSWVAAINGMGNITAYSFVSNGSDLFTGAYQLGVYHSTDNGDNWTPYGLSGSIIHSMALNGVQLFAGIDGGVQRRRVTPALDLAGTDLIANSLPDKVSLSQNYPNPFNPVTTIQFSIPEDENVTLTVFDISGAQVARLVDERLAAGVHERVWDASNVASGMYFYQLTVGGFSEARRLMLVR